MKAMTCLWAGIIAPRSLFWRGHRHRCASVALGLGPLLPAVQLTWQLTPRLTGQLP